MAVGTSTDLRPVQRVKTFTPIPIIAAPLTVMGRKAARAPCIRGLPQTANILGTTEG